MRRKIEPIEIQGTPIQELKKKKKSCTKKGCATGCGCIIFLIFLSLLLLKFITGPRVKELKDLPPNFPTNISLYDKDEIKTINYISGKQKSRGVEIAAFVPKVIISPLIFIFNEDIKKEEIINEEGKITIKKKTSWKDFIEIMKEPITDQRDIVEINWNYLIAEPSFLFEYFKNNLTQNNYEIQIITNNQTKKQLSFSDQEKNIEGVIYIADEPADKGTDYLSITLNLPPQE